MHTTMTESSVRSTAGLNMISLNYFDIVGYAEKANADC